MTEFLDTAMNELASNSPYAIILLALMFFFSHQNKASLEQINSMFQSALQEIRESHSQALQEVRKMVKITTENPMAAIKSRVK